MEMIIVQALVWEVASDDFDEVSDILNENVSIAWNEPTVTMVDKVTVTRL